MTRKTVGAVVLVPDDDRRRLPVNGTLSTLLQARQMLARGASCERPAHFLATYWWLHDLAAPRPQPPARLDRLGPRAGLVCASVMRFALRGPLLSPASSTMQVTSSLGPSGPAAPLPVGTTTGRVRASSPTTELRSAPRVGHQTVPPPARLSLSTRREASGRRRRRRSLRTTSERSGRPGTDGRIADQCSREADASCSSKALAPDLTADAPARV